MGPSVIGRDVPDTFHSNGTYTGFRPVLDGKSLKIRPTPAIIQSKMRKVPVMVG